MTLTEKASSTPSEAPPAPKSSRDTSSALGRSLAFVERFGLVVLLIAVCLFFSFWPATSTLFPTAPNIRTIMANESILVIVAMAALIPLVAERFDLSIGAIVATTSICSAKLMAEAQMPLVVGVLGGILIGAFIGLISGYIIATYNANSLVITLGMSTLLAGLGAYLTGYTSILGMPQALVDFGNRSWLGVPRPVLLFVLVALATSALLGLTVFGRRLLAIGSNESASRLVGIPMERTVMIAFVCSGALAGLAGVLLLARTGSASAGVGVGYTLPALAAIFLGSTTIRPGRFTVLGTLVGVFLVAISINGLTLAGAEDWVEPTFNGAAVVIAVTAAAVLAKRRLGSAR